MRKLYFLAIAVILMLAGHSLVMADTCQKCAAEVSATTKFCPQCGAKVVRQPSFTYCPNCATKLDPQARFCPGCGKAPASSGRTSTATTDGFELGARFSYYLEPAVIGLGFYGDLSDIFPSLPTGSDAKWQWTVDLLPTGAYDFFGVEIGGSTNYLLGTNYFFTHQKQTNAYFYYGGGIRVISSATTYLNESGLSFGLSFSSGYHKNNNFIELGYLTSYSGADLGTVVLTTGIRF